MRFIKGAIQGLIVVEYFILLIEFNMAAHYNYGLPHQEHKKSTYYCGSDKNKPGKKNLFYKRKGIELIN